ncbi:VanZ family protein [Lacticaseibacillus baoqingensis]|uniref:VanZ family protein n=1 Tax=Lacticaseibacillus baoqingensis TaxID=2486013 RepID=A0ABW4E496_9LACO|nr:VanZ family protein [Lacticaseibacillus baoqingensis]
MLFLDPLYQQVAARWSGRINHFPLIRLIFYSLDKTLLYLLVFLAVRWGWALLHHRRLAIGHELRVLVFAGYVILLLMLTVFRDVYYPWQLVFHWHRSLDVINLTPFVETMKLRLGSSHFDFWYQSLGNVLWFFPFGWGMSSLTKRVNTWRVLVRGLALSLVIEALQFLLISGVADIDDVIFNVTGAVVGYWVWRMWHHR